MAPTNYIVVPSTASDAEAIALCGDRAFGPASFRGYIFPESRKHLTPEAEMMAWRTDRFRKILKAGDLLHFKCVPEDDHSKVVGYAAWNRPGHFAQGKSLADAWKDKSKGSTNGEGEEGEVKLKPQSDLTAQAGPNGAKPPMPVDVKEEGENFPAAMDIEVQQECMEIMDGERKKIWGDDANYWYLAGLAVDPDYQGNGLARKMVDMGLAWADADGVPAYLESTPEGAKLYPRFGFKKVGEYGFFDGAHICEFHIRQPGASKTTVAGAEA